MGTSSHAAATNFLTIREVCDDLGLTLRTLRFYEARRLVVPKREGQHRLYRKRDIERLRTVRKLKSFGLSLMEIRELLRNPGDGPFGLTAKLCEELIDRLGAQQAEAETALAYLRAVSISGTTQRNADHEITP